MVAAWLEKLSVAKRMCVFTTLDNQLGDAQHIDNNPGWPAQDNSTAALFHSAANVDERGSLPRR